MTIDWTKVITPADKFAQAKERKFSEISQAHKNYVAGSLMTSLGYPMQFNITDSIMVEGVIKIAETTGQENIYLTDSNDVTHYDVPIADARMVLLEMSTAFAEAHAKKQLLRQQVEAATSEAELENITW